MYGHFCQTPHCSHKTCKKCVLFSDSVEDDRRAMLEAGLEAKKKANEMSTNNGSSATANVDLEKLLEGGALKNRNANAAQPIAHNPINIFGLMAAHGNPGGLAGPAGFMQHPVLAVRAQHQPRKRRRRYDPPNI